MDAQPSPGRPALQDRIARENLGRRADRAIYWWPMITRPRHAAVLLLLAAACGTSKPSQHPAPPQTTGGFQVSTGKQPPARPKGLYSAQEALGDALSGDLEYIGTGRW